MSRSILLPGEVGRRLDAHFTVDGVKQLIADLTTQYGRKPSALMFNEHDRRDMNQDIMAEATEKVAKEDQRPEHDGQAIGYIEGVALIGCREVSRGNCQPIFEPRKVEVSDKLGGEGLVIVGAG